MQFLGLFCSSTFGVRTGKSTLAQQLCYYYTQRINELHGLNLTFTQKNIVFRTDKLIKRAYSLPKYSALILDEGDDLTEHAASEKTREIRRFLRKSGQLNLFIIMILPDFFEMPKAIAMHRSNFLIDVKFEDEFDRGYFEYYNFTDKKKLYVRGKKFNDYDAHTATLTNGRFVNKYCVNEKTYRRMKYQDMVEQNEKEEERISRSVRRIIMIETFGKVYSYLQEKFGLQQKQVGSAFGVTPKTANIYYQEWLKNEKKKIVGDELIENNSTIEKGSYSVNRITLTNDTIILTESEEEKKGESGDDSPQKSGKQSLNNRVGFVDNETEQCNL